MKAIVAHGLARELVRPRTHPNRRIRLTTIDRAVSHMPVHNLLAFRGGPDMAQLRTAFAAVLEHHPDYAGRLERRGLAEYIACRGQGLLLETQELAATLDEIDLRSPAHASMLCATECATDAVLAGNEPLIRFRISRLRDGGVVFASCTVHSLTDGSGLALFLGNLARQLAGEPLLPVALERPELPHSLEDGRAGFRQQQPIILRNLRTLVRESVRGAVGHVAGRLRSALPGARRPAFSTVPVRCVELDREDVENLRRKHGLVLGHVLNAMVLKALAAVSASRTTGRIIYIPVLDIRGRHYADNYSGNAVVMGVVEVPHEELTVAPLQKIAMRLFADNMKALNKKSMREYVSLMRFFKAQIFFRLIKREVSVMIDNVSELSLARIDFGNGAPVDFFMPPPADIWIPFLYICQTPGRGLVFQIADPDNRLAALETELARLVQLEVAPTPAVNRKEVDTEAC